MSHCILYDAAHRHSISCRGPAAHAVVALPLPLLSVSFWLVVFVVMHGRYPPTALRDLQYSRLLPLAMVASRFIHRSVSQLARCPFQRPCSVTHRYGLPSPTGATGCDRSTAQRCCTESRVSIPIWVDVTISGSLGLEMLLRNDIIERFRDDHVICYNTSHCGGETELRRGFLGGVSRSSALPLLGSLVEFLPED